MTKLTEYDPQQDPDPTRMDGLITRHHSRWFHDTMRALKERGETEMFKHLQLQFAAGYWDKKPRLPFSQEEFDARFQALVEKDRQAETDVAPLNLVDESGALKRMDLWLETILIYTYARDQKKVKAWMCWGNEADAPEEFVEAMTERYNAEWGEGVTIKPERLREAVVPFDEDMGIRTRKAELFCFEELARQSGNEEKVRLIRKEGDRVDTLPIYLE